MPRANPFFLFSSPFFALLSCLNMLKKRLDNIFLIDLIRIRRFSFPSGLFFLSSIPSKVYSSTCLYKNMFNVSLLVSRMCSLHCCILELCSLLTHLNTMSWFNTILLQNGINITIPAWMFRFLLLLLLLSAPIALLSTTKPLQYNTCTIRAGEKGHTNKRCCSVSALPFFHLKKKKKKYLKKIVTKFWP